ncbi:unnamed protein product [Phytophthora fragariaefolia]|uniref:Unnamed protein product n=1 Tax=Phytophthora fragariaefolia TaxID=1490495 RepID=A0A9W6Y8L9_9STRA|nr:unnamed protein product [Phytophthora fragariaefolia]
MTSKPSWTALTTAAEGDDLPSDAVLEDLVEVDEEDLGEFDLDQPLPTTLAEGETVKNVKFDPRQGMDALCDLYSHSDKAITTRVLPESVHFFTHSASSSFLAYAPIYFWQQVTHEINAYAALKDIHLVNRVTLPELMKFIGILFFMAINDKGKYANHWGPQPEDAILGSLTSSGLENIMPLRRFKMIRRCFCFRAASTNTNRDPAERIRPLLNPTVSS